MIKFLVGVLCGIVLSSVFWVLYLGYFLEDAADLGRRVREWLRAKLPWKK